MEVEPFIANGVRIDSSWIEQIILLLVDEFDICIAWDIDAAVLTGAFALVGGVLGGYAGGRVGAAIGAGVGGVSGYATSRLVSLRDVWDSIKRNLNELFYIILNFLARLSPDDYKWAFEMLMSCAASRRELVMKIIDFIAQKLGREVISRITAAQSVPINGY
ncbi:PREDICTED: uncharacterized protein LOC106121924 [Papilio xuthus]|uniref:Uncharacterized protein LOC106121924 n=1 Tax=Papilio xuthus TaxID=66420 RepID=A0AAJ7EDQ4_PAPXU|nr:PREDICTED: uncharacterized protein LOC106121924 [Papilio xuthus]